MRKVYIYYDCKWSDIKRIEERFGFPHCVTVNGETCNLWVPEQMVELYRAVICKALIGFSSSERMYIMLVGMEAYRLTLLWMKEHN